MTTLEKVVAVMYVLAFLVIFVPAMFDAPEYDDDELPLTPRGRPDWIAELDAERAARRAARDQRRAARQHAAHEARHRDEARAAAVLTEPRQRVENVCARRAPKRAA